MNRIKAYEPAALRLLIVSVAVMLVLSSLGAPGTPATAQATSRTFPETGKTVSGKFLTYWDTHGGLAQQGFPISEEMQEFSPRDGKTYTVQYFERAVFEYHPEYAGTPYEVLLSLIGVDTYQQKYPDGAPNQVPSDEPVKRVFPETGKTVGGVWLDYWNTHGGLAQQGLPISEIFQEKSDLDGKTYAVQYFERAVFEYHPEYAGTPAEILLSQLGTYRYRARYLQAPATATAVPTAAPPSPTPIPASALADFVWRSTGAPNTFSNAAGIRADKQGNLYVVDAGNERIQKLDPQGTLITQWGSEGTGDGQFKFHDTPHGDIHFGWLAVDAQGNVYVSDMGNRRVQKFDSDGQFLLKWGSEGTADGQFQAAGSIAVDSGGNVYVGDDLGNTVQKFDANGKFLQRIGKVGVGEGEFGSPGGMTVDAQDNLYLADYENSRIDIFTADGHFVRMFGIRGHGDGQFRRAQDVAVDRQGNIYVINDDPQLNFVQKFTNEGQYLGKFGTAGEGAPGFDALFALTLDGLGNIYVSDIALNTPGAPSNVQKFRLR